MYFTRKYFVFRGLETVLHKRIPLEILWVLKIIRRFSVFGRPLHVFRSTLEGFPGSTDLFMVFWDQKTLEYIFC